LSHDLRSPLSAILIGAQLLERKLSGEEHHQLLRRILSSGERMAEMVEQLLDLTRARLKGGLDLVRETKPLDVGSLVQRTLEELRSLYPRQAITIEIEGDCTTSGDPNRLLQVFSNLLSNALNHGSSPVSVSVQGAEREVTVKIQNGGVIPSNLLPRLFDPFYKKPSKRSRGLGLGLFISQQIVLAHGGSVEIESNEELGVVSTVRLPRHPAAQEKPNT
jgi:signal transduction histidine kinase